MPDPLPYQSFSSDGVDIAFIDLPADQQVSERLPVLLIHGFASNIPTNWIDTGWTKTLTAAGHRTIAMDNRGHGRSAKLYDDDAYTTEMMADDAIRLIEHLGIPSVHVFGFSMGARNSAQIALKAPEKLASVVFGGLGKNMVNGIPGARPIAQGFLKDSIDEITNPTVRTFRAFAESTNSDLKALAHCIRASRGPISAETLAQIRVPVLVAVGTDDVVGGSPSELAALIPKAQAFDIQGRDHMKSVGDRTFKQRVLDYFAEHEQA